MTYFRKDVDSPAVRCNSIVIHYLDTSAVSTHIVLYQYGNAELIATGA